jgi:hypothetical protein
MLSLLKLVLAFDSANPKDSMSNVIAFVTRMSVRLELMVTYVLENVELLSPRNESGLDKAQRTLWDFLIREVPPTMTKWLSVLEKEHGTQTERQNNDYISCNIHAHLILMHSNAKAFQFNVKVVGTMLSSFAFITTRKPPEKKMKVSPMHVFQILQTHRAHMMAWLNAEDRDAVSFNEVLNRTFLASTGVENTKPWARLVGDGNEGRFVILKSDSPDDFKHIPLCNEGSGYDVEFNLQVMQVVTAGVILMPIPSGLQGHEDIKRLFPEPHALMAAPDATEYTKKYNVLSHGYLLIHWFEDHVAKDVSKQNEKEKKKQEEKKRDKKAKGKQQG